MVRCAESGRAADLPGSGRRGASGSGASDLTLRWALSETYTIAFKCPWSSASRADVAGKVEAGPKSCAIATPKAAVPCASDPSKCVKGAKLPEYWFALSICTD